MQTDHKPLVSLFNQTKGIPLMAAGRVQRWALYLSAFDFNIEHVSSNQNISDILSRLPNSDCDYTDDTLDNDYDKLYLNFISENFPVKSVTYQQVKSETRKDKELSVIFDAIKNGKLKFLKHNLVDIKPFQCRAEELAIEGDVILWGYRVVVPAKLRQSILKDLHITHMGIVKTKAMCRSYFWWPGIDKDVESMIKSCKACNLLLPDPKMTELIPWKSAQAPWSRIHIDYAGPFKGFHFLVVVDSFSKWIEVGKTKHPNADFTLNTIYELFCRFGLPDEIVEL